MYSIDHLLFGQNVNALIIEGGNSSSCYNGISNLIPPQRPPLELTFAVRLPLFDTGNIMTTFPFPLFDCNLPRGEMMLFGLTWLASVKLGVTGEVGPPLTDEFTF